MNAASIAGLSADEKLEMAARDFEARVRSEHRTLDLRGAKISQKIKTILTLEVQKQLLEFANMEACSGIKGNPSAAYKARKNHYGGVSSWGMILPVRRWVDSAYSTNTSTYDGIGVHTSFTGSATNSIKEYLKKNIVTNITTRNMDFMSSSRDYGTDKEYLAHRKFKERQLGRTENNGGNRNLENAIAKQKQEENIKSEYYKGLIDQANAPIKDGGRGMNVTADAIPYSTGMFGMWNGQNKPKQPREVMQGLADKMRYNQLRAIDRMEPRNAPATVKLKGFDKPLVETGEMISAIEAWVTTKEK